MVIVRVERLRYRDEFYEVSDARRRMVSIQVLPRDVLMKLCGQPTGNFPAIWDDDKQQWLVWNGARL